MTDIVERLDRLLDDINMYDHYRPVIRKAAKEIERLRVEFDRQSTLNTEAATDIARLRAKLAEYENVPVRLRHIMATGKMPPDDVK